MDRWCDGLVSVTTISLGDGVFAQALGGFQRVGQRFDASGVDRLHLIDQPENAVKCFGGTRDIGVIETQSGQMSDLLDRKSVV